ncbi:putative pre-mRNA-splicing regulator WTAP [Helianthus annuus]|nr:putative pre-mRNA-splicing regulator WTAP [Helianthus annuus]
MEGLTDDVEKSNEMLLILEEKLNDREAGIKRLRHQLQQYDVVEEKTDTLATDEKDTNADVTVPMEPEPEPKAKLENEEL